MKLNQEVPLQTEKTISLIELVMEGGLGGQLIIGLLFILLVEVVCVTNWWADAGMCIKSGLNLSCICT